MSTLPGQDQLHPQPARTEAEDVFIQPDQAEEAVKAQARAYDFPADPMPPPTGPLLFQAFTWPEPAPPPRIPHFGHLVLLLLLSCFGLFCAGLFDKAALHFHLFGISDAAKALTDVRYTLGSMAALYLVTFAAAWFVFPLLWEKSLLAGIHFNPGTALRLRAPLFGAAFVCFLLAIADEILIPGPTNAPIDKLFQTPTEAWLLFAFGVTFAPFFEETLFRGFLLPALATAFDWSIDRSIGKRPRPVDPSGQPQWSLPAMAVASVLTSIPFALMHAEQTAHAVGPFVLLVCVSMVLCWVRLSTRSLAASMLVHASYNFLLFALMLIGTQGFRHLEKL